MPDGVVCPGSTPFCASFAGAIVSKGRSFTSPGRLIRFGASHDAITISVVVLTWTFRRWSVPCAAGTSIERVRAGQIGGWLVRIVAEHAPASVYLWDSRDAWFGQQMEGLGYGVTYPARVISPRTLR